MFSIRLKELRMKRGLTQLELAGILKVGKSIISMYENEKRKPSYEMLETIADYFNVDMDFLLGRVPDNVIMGWAEYAENYYATHPDPLTSFAQELLSVCSGLNDEGRDKVLEYASDLLGMDKYKKGYSLRLSEAKGA